MAPTEPMPFTIEVGLETLASHSKGAIITSPYDADLSSTLTAVIRKHPDLADWQLVAEHAAAGSFSWMKNSKPGLKWIAKTGNMADAIGLARDWNAAGRPSNTSPKPTHTGWTQPASHNAESTTVEDF